MSTFYPPDETPPIPDITPYINGSSLNLALMPNLEEFEKYFEIEMRGWFKVKKKQRVQIIQMTYGDKFITDTTVFARVYTALRDRQPLVITNETVGPDPKPNEVKDFVIRYTNTGNDDERYIKVRCCKEGETLDFGWDITSIKYGCYPDIWHMDNRPQVFRNCFIVFDRDCEMIPSVKFMDGCDPSRGKRNVLEIVYHDASKDRSYSMQVQDFDRARFTGRWG